MKLFCANTILIDPCDFELACLKKEKSSELILAIWQFSHPQKCAHPTFLLKVIAKGHLLLKCMPTKQTKIICSSMHSDKIRSVHVCVS